MVANKRDSILFYSNNRLINLTCQTERKLRAGVTDTIYMMPFYDDVNLRVYFLVFENRVFFTNLNAKFFKLMRFLSFLSLRIN